MRRNFFLVFFQNLAIFFQQEKGDLQWNSLFNFIFLIFLKVHTKKKG
jgi:hypothetical protein